MEILCGRDSSLKYCAILKKLFTVYLAGV